MSEHVITRDETDPGPLIRPIDSAEAQGRDDREQADTAPQGPLEVVEARGPDGYAFHFKVLATGQMYRIEPARDPGQPRFWCFRILRCMKGGMADPTELPWLGAGGMRRDELEAASQTIRADINAWLAAEPLADLRRWVLADAPQHTVAAMIGKR